MSNLVDDILDHLRQENVWANAETLLGVANSKIKAKRKKRVKMDEMMSVIGVLVANGLVIFEFHSGDAMYAAKPESWLR